MRSRGLVAGRAAVGVGMLIGFYLLVALVIVGAVGLNVAVVAWLGRPPAWLVLASGLVVVGLLRAVLFLDRVDEDPDEGIAVTRHDEPALWALVDETAAAVGTRAPDELILVDDVNASVTELGGFLGLRAGRRQLRMGLALLNVLDVPQTRAVLAHEMGHYSGGDTRLGPVSYRGSASIGRAIAHLGSATMLGRLFRLYARLYWRVTLAVRRRQELSADALAVTMAGRDAFASSLRAVAVAGPAYRFLLDRYAAPVWAHGQHPADLYAGLRALLGDDRRTQELEALLQDATERVADRYDSHPSLGERLAAITAVSEDGSSRSIDADRAPAPGRTLLRDPAASERAMSLLVARRAIGGDTGDSHEWEDVASTVYGPDLATEAHATMTTLARLDGTGMPTLRRFLDAVDSDQVLALAVALSGDVSGVPKDRRADLQAAVMKDRTVAVVASALVDQGRAAWRLSWGGPVEVVTPDDAVLDLDLLVSRALDDDGMAGLRERLFELGVDERWKPSAPAVPVGRGEELVDVINDLRRVRRRCDLLVFPERFAVISYRLSPADALVVGLSTAMGGSARGSGPFARRCADLVRTPLPELVARDARNRSARWDEVVDARLTRRLLGGWRLQLLLRDGELLDLVSLGSAPKRKAVEALLLEHLPR